MSKQNGGGGENAIEAPLFHHTLLIPINNIKDHQIEKRQSIIPLRLWHSTKQKKAWKSSRCFVCSASLAIKL